MKFKVYEAEKNLGLEMKMRANASLSYITPAIPEKTLMKAALETKIVDDTLYPIVDILVSAGPKHGWNLNDDVFASKPTWEARNSPLHKPLDLEHDQSNIIGAIIGTRVVDDDLNVIDESAYEDGSHPENFHILNDSVIYRTWADDKKLEETDELIQDIKDGKYFMSMEAQFWDYDFALESPDGTKFTIARNEDTAFLSSYLRAYDGKGYYTDASTGDKYKIGRQMAHINFVGKGLVKNPGNPKSTIISNKAVVYSKEEESLQTSTEQEIIVMDPKEKEAYEARIAELEAKLNESREIAVASTKSELEKTKAELSGETEKVSALEAAKADLEQAKDEAVAKLAELQAQLDTVNAEKARNDRKKKMVDAGYSEADAEAKVDAYKAMDDSGFDTLVAEIAEIRKAVPTPTSTEAGEALLANAKKVEAEPVVPKAPDEKPANAFASKLGSILNSTKTK